VTCAFDPRPARRQDCADIRKPPRATPRPLSQVPVRPQAPLLSTVWPLYQQRTAEFDRGWGHGGCWIAVGRVAAIEWKNQPQPALPSGMAKPPVVMRLAASCRAFADAERRSSSDSLGLTRNPSVQRSWQPPSPSAQIRPAANNTAGVNWFHRSQTKLRVDRSGGLAGIVKSPGDR
jgi:hypothetical protein